MYYLTRKKVVFLLAFFAIFCSVIFVASRQYNLDEKAAHKLMTDDCILSAVSMILIDYYKKNREYPDHQLLKSVVFDNGYPGGVGCGTTSINKVDDIVDSDGNELIYEYESPGSVSFYFDSKIMTNRIIYKLVNNEIIKP